MVEILVDDTNFKVVVNPLTIFIFSLNSLVKAEVPIKTRGISNNSNLRRFTTTIIWVRVTIMNMWKSNTISNRKCFTSNTKRSTTKSITKGANKNTMIILEMGKLQMECIMAEARAREANVRETRRRDLKRRSLLLPQRLTLLTALVLPQRFLI